MTYWVGRTSFDTKDQARAFFKRLKDSAQRSAPRRRPGRSACPCRTVRPRKATGDRAQHHRPAEPDQRRPGVLHQDPERTNAGLQLHQGRREVAIGETCVREQNARLRCRVRSGGAHGDPSPDASIRRWLLGGQGRGHLSGIRQDDVEIVVGRRSPPRSVHPDPSPVRAGSLGQDLVGARALPERGNTGTRGRRPS